MTTAQLQAALDKAWATDSEQCAELELPKVVKGLDAWQLMCLQSTLGKLSLMCLQSTLGKLSSVVDDRCDYCKEHGIENCRHEGM